MIWSDLLDRDVSISLIFSGLCSNLDLVLPLIVFIASNGDDDGVGQSSDGIFQMMTAPSELPVIMNLPHGLNLHTVMGAA